MKIKIETLSPLHIGSGEEISPIEYIAFNSKTNEVSKERLDGDRIIRLDMDGLFKDVKFKQVMEKFINSATSQRYIGTLLPKELLLNHPLYSIEISSSAKNSNPIAIKSFIKSAGRVYIPGSSLKGSILSAVIWKKAKEKRIRNSHELENLMDTVIGEVSNSPLANKFSHWLNVSDSDFKSPEESLELTLVKVENIQGRSSLPILYETLKIATVFHTEIKTSINSIDRFGRLSEEEILRISEEFYRKVYQKEKKSKLPQSLPTIPQNGFLLRLGQGSTCLATSLLILAEELGIRDYKIFRRRLPPIRIGEEPRTRKLISKRIPLGWVKISWE